jgi:hypothetical protein
MAKTNHFNVKTKIFDVEKYKRRLQILREVISGDSQTAFANRLGIKPAKWSNYERGFPVPRETAFLLKEKFDVSVEWLWFGLEGNMPAELKARIRKAETHERDLAAARKQLADAQAQLRETELKRKKDLHPSRR